MEEQRNEADFEEGEIEDDEPTPLNDDRKPANAVSASDSLSDSDSDRKGKLPKRRRAQSALYADAEADKRPRNLVMPLRSVHT